MAKRPILRTALDESVPNAVGRAFEAAGHDVVYLNRMPTRGATDREVTIFAEVNRLVLVAIDKDMKTIARGQGVSNSRFKLLNLIKLSCSEVDAASRVAAAMSLIEHEWQLDGMGDARRMFIEISATVIKTYR